VFLTDEEEAVPLTALLRACYVAQPGAVPDLATWLEWRDHFFARLRFATLTPLHWDERHELGTEDLTVCGACAGDKMEDYAQMMDFRDAAGARPLRIFDPFAGVGAFALAFEELGGHEDDTRNRDLT